ncbi:MAG: heparinase II/III family protein [Planctomycetes bacterium]|nr:heparinase II/III family protein [Planctomycetota bacterium]
MIDIPPRWSAVPREHPRLLGSLDRLRELARQRPDAYRRMRVIARDRGVEDASEPDPYARIVHRCNKLTSMALVAAIDGDAAFARRTVDVALAWHVDRPPQVGHVTFGHDMAYCALVFDLCYDAWTPDERARLFVYLGACRDANIDEEPSPFHNGWWGYKHWGFGMAAMATLGEWERAPAILAQLDHDLEHVANPSLEFCGAGGCFAEGFYTHYWTYEWLVFCASAQLCAGVDLFAGCPSFYHERAVASMFEMYPGLQERGSRRGVAFGDAGGRRFATERERDKARAARNILVGRYRGDAAHQAVAAYQAQSPGCGADENAYKDFLWDDPTVARGDLRAFKLSHHGVAAGMVHARSSWTDDATYFAFKCGKRFTAHQHLDNGHFYIWHKGELAGRGGHYVDFAGSHDVNYYIRSIAHSTILVHDPSERFPFLMKGMQAWPANDGGQAWPWVGTPFRHNGAATDKTLWLKHRELGDIADLMAYHDAGVWLYTGGDLTRSYSAKKLKRFTRQIVYIRPGTFIVCDQVESTDPSFRKSWVLQAAEVPSGSAPRLTVTSHGGRLTIETLLPADPLVTLHHGEALYDYEGRRFTPGRDTGPCAACRIEISPRQPAAFDCFVHVLTAADADAAVAAPARLERRPGRVEVTVAGAVVRFDLGSFGGSITIGGSEHALAQLPLDQRAPADRERG